MILLSIYNKKEIIMKKKSKEIKIKYDNGSVGKIKKDQLSQCPECKQQTVRAKTMGEGGGVVCINKKCNYWFCY